MLIFRDVAGQYANNQHRTAAATASGDPAYKFVCVSRAGPEFRGDGPFGFIPVPVFWDGFAKESDVARRWADMCALSSSAWVCHICRILDLTSGFYSFGYLECRYDPNSDKNAGGQYGGNDGREERKTEGKSCARCFCCKRRSLIVRWST